MYTRSLSHRSSRENGIRNFILWHDTISVCLPVSWRHFLQRDSFLCRICSQRDDADRKVCFWFCWKLKWNEFHLWHWVNLCNCFAFPPILSKLWTDLVSVSIVIFFYHFPSSNYSPEGKVLLFVGGKKTKCWQTVCFIEQKKWMKRRDRLMGSCMAMP